MAALRKVDTYQVLGGELGTDAAKQGAQIASYQYGTDRGSIDKAQEMYYKRYNDVTNMINQGGFAKPDGKGGYIWETLSQPQQQNLLKEQQQIGLSLSTKVDENGNVILNQNPQGVYQQDVNFYNKKAIANQGQEYENQLYNQGIKPQDILDNELRGMLDNNTKTINAGGVLGPNNFALSENASSLIYNKIQGIAAAKKDDYQARYLDGITAWNQEAKRQNDIAAAQNPDIAAYNQKYGTNYPMHEYTPYKYSNAQEFDNIYKQWVADDVASSLNIPNLDAAKYETLNQAIRHAWDVNDRAATSGNVNWQNQYMPPQNYQGLIYNKILQKGMGGYNYNQQNQFGPPSGGPFVNPAYMNNGQYEYLVKP